MLGLCLALITLFALTITQNCFACSDKNVEISCSNENYINIFDNNEALSAYVIARSSDKVSPVEANLKDLYKFRENNH